MNKIKIVLLFLLTTVLTFSEIILDVSNTLPGSREPIKVSVEFINTSKDNYKLEGMDNFEIMSKGSSNKYYSYNGKTTSSKTDTYILMPKKAGRFKLVAVTRKERSNEVIVNVKETKTATENNEKFFMTDKIGKKEYYFGQKIPFEEIFTSTVNLRTFDILKRPDFPGFTVKEITPQSSSGTLMQRKTRINGREAFQVVLFQGILQANSSGEKFITGGEAEVREDDYNSFASLTLPKYVGSKETKVNILPLPADKPANFQDVVGVLKGDFKWSTDKISYGQAATLNLRLFGDVNLDLLEKILPETPEKFNVYENVKDSKEEILSDGNYWAEKSFEIAFVPKESGEIETSEIKIPYFNTETKKYEFFIIPPHKIIVEGKSQVTPVKPEPSKIQTVTPETPPVQTDNSEKITLLPKGELPAEVKQQRDYKLIAAILLGICALQGVVLGVLFVKRRKPNSSGNSDLLKAVKKSRNDKELYDSYCQFLKEAYDFSPKAHSEEKLLKNGAPEELISLNREIEENIYKNISLNKKKIIEILKKAQL